MKVIKVITQTGLCYQGYGAEIQDNFAAGTYGECLEAIKKDIIFNAKCEPDSGTKLIFLDGMDAEDADPDLLTEWIEEEFEDADNQVMQFVIRLEADDLYNSIYEITYQILEDKKKMYFTFGSDPGFPHQNTYLIVEGKDEEDCIRIFRAKYPDRHPGCVNCAFWYTEKQWFKLGMYSNEKPVEVLRAA